MMTLLRAIAVIATLSPTLAFGQAQPSGKFTPSHALIATTASGSPYADAGGAAGSKIYGSGYINEIGITNTGTPFCITDTLLTAPYHQLCLGASALGGGLLSFNAYNHASQTGFTFLINGASYAFPGVGAGNVEGPNTSTVNEPVLWNSTLGTLVKDGLHNNLLHNGNMGITGYTANLLSSENVLYFSNYNQTASVTMNLALSGAVSDAAGSFQDSLYASISDSDTSSGYANSHTDYAGRFAAFGPYSGGWQTSDKNIVALNAYGLAATTSTPIGGLYAPGVSGINADAFQYGAGISDNEFAAHNPSAANGGTAHSISIAAVQGILDNSYAVADSTHTAYAFLASNIGTYTATAAYAASGTTPYIRFIDPMSATVTVAGIAMPGGSSYLGTIIDYGVHNGNPAGGSYTWWNGALLGGAYNWVDSGVQIASLTTQGLTVSPASGYDAFYAAPVSGTGSIAYAAVGAWQDGLNINGATIGDAGIVLQNTVHGSTIKYDANDYSLMSSATTYEVVIGGVAALQVTNGGITVTSCTGCIGSGGGMNTNGSNATGGAFAAIAAAQTTLLGGFTLANGGPIMGMYGSISESLLYINSGGTLVLGFGTGSGVPVQTIGPIIDSNLASSGTQCVEAIADGQLVGTGSPCGSGGGGGMNTSGSNATSAAFTNIVANSPSLTTPLVLANGTAINGLYGITSESLLYINSGGTLVLGFGTGAGLPVQTLGPIVDSNLASSGVQCVQAAADGQLEGTGTACGSGGGGMATNASNATSAAMAALVGAQTVSTPITGNLYLNSSGASIEGVYGGTAQSLLYLNSGDTEVVGFGTGAGLNTWLFGALFVGSVPTAAISCPSGITAATAVFINGIITKCS
jgi:hypothetical protein